MAGAAYANGQSQIQCTDGAKGSGCGKDVWHWDTPTTQVTGSGSGNVFINGKAAIREGDPMATHPDGNPCVASPVNHTPTLSSFSSTVKVNGKGMGRVGDKFNSDSHHDHTIVSGSGNVNVG